MNKLKTAFNALAIVASFQMTWAALAVVPAEWFWFDPGDYYVSDGTAEQVPTIAFDRTIKREVQMTYQVIIRRVGGEGHGGVVCDPLRGPFPYRPDATLLETIDLVWWTGGDARCWPREPGTYVSETCWTVVRPFFGIVPPKTVCRRSNVFTIR